MKKTFIGIIALALILFGVYLWKNKAKTINPLANGESVIIEQDKSKNGFNTVRLAYISEIGDISLLYDFASDKGFFKKNNVDVQIVPAQKDFTNYLISGAADVLIGSYSGPLSSYLGNGQVRLLANVSKPFSYFGLSRFPQNQFSSIKRVGVNTLSGDPQITAREALKNMGVNPDNVELVAIPTQEAREAALAKGDIDFMVLSSEKFLLENQLDKKYIVVDPSVINKNTKTLRVITASQSAIDSNPQGVKGFISALYQSVQYMKNNPEETKEFISNKYGYDAAHADAFYARFLGSLDGVSFIPDTATVTSAADVVKEIFKIESNRDVSGYIYSDFAKQAIVK